MAGRRAPYPFRPLGPIELKGLSEPLEAFVVEWTPLEEVKESRPVVALPPRLCHKPGVGVIGRSTEAELLIDRIQRVLAGEGREVVLISGEAGEGKTTLAAHVARKVFDNGACVLLGRCDEDLGVSYGPFVEALTHYVTHTPEEALYSHVQSHGAELANSFPHWRIASVSSRSLRARTPIRNATSSSVQWSSSSPTPRRSIRSFL